MTMLIGWCDESNGLLVMGCDDRAMFPGGGCSVVKKWASLNAGCWLLCGVSYMCQLSIIEHLWSRCRHPIRHVEAALPVVREIALARWQLWRQGIPDTLASVGWSMPPESALGVDLLIGGVDRGQLRLWLARSANDFTWRDMRGSIPVCCPDENLGQFAYDTLRAAVQAGLDPVDALKTAIRAAAQEDARVGAGGMVLGLLEGKSGYSLAF